MRVDRVTMKMKCNLPSFAFLCLFLCLFHSIEITPPPTPSPVKAAGGGKKRAISSYESDDNNVFVPRYYLQSDYCIDGLLTSML